MAREGKDDPSAAALALERAVQRFAEKHAELAKRATDLEAPATEPIRQDKPELPPNNQASDVAAAATEPPPQVPTNEACRRNPMKTAGEYRDKAAECERLARDGDADLRALYGVQAAHWRFLAEQADNFEAQARKRKNLDAPSEQ